MANACGSGFTTVGWDDAGCGKKKCVSKHLPNFHCVYLNTIYSIAENPYVVQRIRPRKIAYGVGTIMAKAQGLIVVGNAPLVKQTSKGLPRPGVVAS